MVDNRDLKIRTLTTPHQERARGSGVRTGFGTGPGAQYPAAPGSGIQAREDRGQPRRIIPYFKTGGTDSWISLARGLMLAALRIRQGAPPATINCEHSVLPQDHFLGMAG